MLPSIFDQDMVYDPAGSVMVAFLSEAREVSFLVYDSGELRLQYSGYAKNFLDAFIRPWDKSGAVALYRGTLELLGRAETHAASGC